MDPTGKPREGWMAIIPGGIFLIFVVFILGGPRHFLNTIGMWISDVVAALQGWLKSF